MHWTSPFVHRLEPQHRPPSELGLFDISHDIQTVHMFLIASLFMNHGQIMEDGLLSLNL